jgi:uncharacterized protein YcbK (DUF882 family)
MFKYFDLEDFACQATGENGIEEAFVARLDQLRANCGFPFIITSGFRSVRHPLEARKPGGGGTHTKGYASDIAVSGGAQRHKLVEEALKMGFTGIGVAHTFIHLDDRTTTSVLWVY